MGKHLTAYCIVTEISQAQKCEPDLGHYSPKELAAKEHVSQTCVYNWLNAGLPCMRQGKFGNIRIYYQDYIQWMIDCASEQKSVRDIPGWAFRFVRSATPRPTFAETVRIPEGADFRGSKMLNLKPNRKESDIPEQLTLEL